jgi:hypothetical protein
VRRATYRILVGRPVGKDCLEDVGITRRIILKYITWKCVIEQNGLQDNALDCSVCPLRGKHPLQDLKVCDDGTLVQILCVWTLSIILSLPKKHHPISGDRN